jgi:threonine aldolase
VLFEATDPPALVAACRAEGLLLAPFGPGRVRAVTHRDVDDAGIARALTVLRAVVR